MRQPAAAEQRLRHAITLLGGVDQVEGRAQRIAAVRRHGVDRGGEPAQLAGLEVQPDSSPGAGAALVAEQEPVAQRMPVQMRTQLQRPAIGAMHRAQRVLDEIDDADLGKISRRRIAPDEGQAGHRQIAAGGAERADIEEAVHEVARRRRHADHRHGAVAGPIGSKGEGDRLARRQRLGRPLQPETAQGHPGRRPQPLLVLLDRVARAAGKALREPPHAGTSRKPAHAGTSQKPAHAGTSQSRLMPAPAHRCARPAAPAGCGRPSRRACAPTTSVRL